MPTRSEDDLNRDTIFLHESWRHTQLIHLDISPERPRSQQWMGNFVAWSIRSLRQLEC
jgi:hypothetical protein